MPRGVTHKYPPDDEIVRLAGTVTDKRALSRKLGIPDPTFYGFLSRNPDLQKRVEDALIVSVVEPTDDRDPLDAEIHGMLKGKRKPVEIHELADSRKQIRQRSNMRRYPCFRPQRQQRRTVRVENFGVLSERT